VSEVREVSEVSEVSEVREVSERQVSDDRVRQEQARRFADAFTGIYLATHRRDGKQSQLSAVSRGVLRHLSMTGPLTIGETAVHLDRAQSVVSDIVTQLEGNDLVERMTDPRDRRRTLVWLTPLGLDRLEQDRQVLALELVDRALARLTEPDREVLLRLMEQLTEPT
jgi:DNA-binding MarR family transcriptional regulator